MANQDHTQLAGLTEAEVLDRRRRGQGNNVRLDTSRSYADIIRHNVLNLINIILFVIGGVMIAIGRVGDAVTTVGLIIFNVIIGVYQEIRAKRQLDQIALLTRPKITVMREGHEKTVDPSELVVGDVIVMRAGDQMVVDGVVIGGGKVEVDESMLTGESDSIIKAAGDDILSGSFCIAGSALYEATRVGEESFANKLTANARKFAIAHTPLQREINFLLRLLLLLAIFIGSTMFVGAIISGLPFLRQVQMAAVVAGLVPNGLFFMVILAYAMGALRIVQRGALVQQSNAVESLSNVTVLCTDKTGTLTANKINYHDVYPVEIEPDRLKHLIGTFARSASATNKTSEALIAGLEGEKLTPVDEVPFSSALKWSALAFDQGDMRGVYVLGALSMLQDKLEVSQDAVAQIEQWSDAGLRVLVFAHHAADVPLHNAAGKPELPALTLLGAVSLSDELRPFLKETIAGFSANGIALKVISGDNPQTVAALARQAGFAGELKYVSGTDLGKMDDAQFAQVAAETTVFGRITPDQKERLVDTLQQQGHYVAMIGDGVNDVLSLKKANLGIAMESGSAATRGVADMILIGDSFNALPAAFSEGQRIVNGMKDILRLFLTRVAYAALMIIAIDLIGLGFPFIPKQNSLLVGIGVGLPTLGLAVWARPGPVPKRGMLREIARFVVPAAMSISFFGVIVYALAFTVGIINALAINVTPDTVSSFQEYIGIDYTLTTVTAYQAEVAHLVAQTALTSFTVFASLILVVFVEPPIQFFVAGDEFSGDWRPTLLAIGLFVVYMIIVLAEPLRSFFEMIDLPLLAYVGLGAITLIWMLLLRRAWRHSWLERFLQIDRM
ncbi:MAG: HAD-IC family P-type ATPase [Anaerolineae bacterium]|nr:HAD-IC family P-type ATPase [Anaerolineae bacterium]